MKPRNTLIALAILIAVVVYILLVEWRGAEQKRARDAAERAVWTVSEEQVEQFTVSHSNRAVTVTRSGDGWRVVDPLETAGDPVTTQAVVRAIASLERESVVDPDPAGGYEKYGLDPPELALSWRGSEGRSGEVRIGRSSPLSPARYARAGNSPEVFLVAAGQVAAIDKSLFDLRSKRLLQFDPDDVTEIRIKLPGEEVKLQRESGRWWLIAPLRDYGRDEDIRALLDDLRYLEATEFVLDRQPLPQYGLDTPNVRVTLERGTAFPSLVLLLGSDLRGGKAVYAMNPEEPHVAVVPPGILANAQKTSKRFRENRAFPVPRWAIESLRIELAPGGLILSRSTDETGGAGGWQVAALPQEGEPRPVDWEAVDDLLRELTELTSRTFLAEPPPEARKLAALEATLQDATEPGPGWTVWESDDTLLVSQEGRPFTLVVSPALRELLQEKAAALLPPAKDTLPETEISE